MTPVVPVVLGKLVAVAIANATLRDLITDALNEEGYDAQVVGPGTVAEDVVRLQPDALLLEIGSWAEHVTLLDTLRSRAESGRTPVISLSLSRAHEAETQASGNVHTTMRMPFDLSDLFQAVEAATGRRPAESRTVAQPLEPDEAFGRTADALGVAERAIMLQWVPVARMTPPFAIVVDLGLREQNPIAVCEDAVGLSVAPVIIVYVLRPRASRRGSARAPRPIESISCGATRGPGGHLTRGRPVLPLERDTLGALGKGKHQHAAVAEVSQPYHVGGEAHPLERRIPWSPLHRAHPHGLAHPPRCGRSHGAADEHLPSHRLAHHLGSCTGHRVSRPSHQRAPQLPLVDSQLGQPALIAHRRQRRTADTPATP